MNHADALALVRESLAAVVPGPEPDGLGPDEPFREALDMDSLDFLRFVETLAERTGVSIPDEDTSRLTTLTDSAAFLAERAS